MHSACLAEAVVVRRRWRRGAGDDVVGWTAGQSALNRGSSAVDTASGSVARSLQIAAVEVGVIEEVEEVHAELDPETFLHVPVLRQLGIHVCGWRAEAGTAGRQVGGEGPNRIPDQGEVVRVQDLVLASPGIAADR